MPKPLKSSTELDASRTQIRFKSEAGQPEPPINAVVSQLTATDGELLELMTRTNPAIAQAAALALVYSDCFGIDYVHRQVAQLERLAVSSSGEGRRELIDALRAGGSLPAEYYSGGVHGGWGGEIRSLREDEENEED